MYLLLEKAISPLKVWLKNENRKLGSLLKKSKRQFQGYSHWNSITLFGAQDTMLFCVQRILMYRKHIGNVDICVHVLLCEAHTSQPKEACERHINLFLHLSHSLGQHHVKFPCYPSPHLRALCPTLKQCQWPLLSHNPPPHFTQPQCPSSASEFAQWREGWWAHAECQLHLGH